MIVDDGNGAAVIAAVERDLNVIWLQDADAFYVHQIEAAESVFRLASDA